MTTPVVNVSVPFPAGAVVLEIGGGDTPYFHPNMDMRKLPSVDIVTDLEGTWPIADKTYDGVFGKFVIEHMSWRAIPHFASECFRVLRPGGSVMMIGPNTLEQCKEIARRDRITKDESAMLFGGQEERGWNEHKSAFSPAYAIEIFKAAGFERVETEPWPVANTDMIIRAWKGAGPAPASSYPQGYAMFQQEWFRKLQDDLKVKSSDTTATTGTPGAVMLAGVTKKAGMNIGSFTVMVKDSETTDWLNTDILDMTAYAREKGYRFQQFDARKSVPWGSGVADFIVASHFLEHITRREADSFLQECFRVLKPGGIVRIAVPDLSVLARDYVDGCFLKRYQDNEGVKNAEDVAEAFWNLLTSGHVTAYNEDGLIAKILKAGFGEVIESVAGGSRSPEIQKDTVDMFPDHSCYIEGEKPMTRKELLAKPVEERRPILEKQVEKLLGQETRSDAELASYAQAKTQAYIKEQDEKKLRIGLISTPFFGCPPKGYSGLEQVVWDLAMGLSGRGHFVRLFAPEGSQCPPGGELVTTGPALMRTDVDWLKEEQDDWLIVKDHVNDLDILHGHDWFGCEYFLNTWNNPRANNIGKIRRPFFSNKVCHTHHGHLSTWWLNTYPPYKLNFMGVSQFMMNQYKAQGMSSRYVYNGIDMTRYQYQEKKNSRLLFVGRFDRFKQPHIAIELAKKLGLGLDLVGGTFVNDKAYLEQIKAAADGKQICFYPDVTQEEKVKFYQNAKCVIFPSKMNEPFGLIVPEANACGTPVIGTRDGAIPETIAHGINGFLADTIDEMEVAIFNLPKIKAEDCRKRVEQLFTRERMAESYERHYRDMLKGDEW